MRLAARLSWTSTFRLILVSVYLSSFLVEAKQGGTGTYRPVNQTRTIEYTPGYKAEESTTEFKASALAEMPPRHIHPIYEAREFLVEHNKIRKIYGEPPLVWDKQLAHYARRFADQRVGTCEMVHSQGPYGENIYWGANFHSHTASDAVRAWAGETNDYDAMKNTCKPMKLCGHYKQIVWKSSARLGCARVKCNTGGVYIICSYDPPGNYIGESPFDEPPAMEDPPQSSQTPPTPVVAQTPPTPVVAQTPPTPAVQKQPLPVAQAPPTVPSA